MRGADIVARSLERLGCRRIFTLSGNHIMSLFDATLETKVKLVHVRHEAAAVHMADGWGRLTGEPGVAMVTGGPGHVNTIGALFAALSSESPMVLLSGHAATREFGFQEPMRLDYRPIGVRPFFPKPTSSPRRSRRGRSKIAPVRVRAHASLLRPIMAHLSYLSFSNNINDIVWPY
jgi:hypothetical protein